MNTDVLVLAVSVYEQLQEEMEELWVEFGAGKNRKFFPIQETLEHIGDCKARGFPPDAIRCRFCHMSPKVQLGKSAICSMM